MDFMSQLITWINIPANFISFYLLWPVGVLPGWLSNTIISTVAGVFLLIVFKYTSNQKAIGRIRDGIKADMLTIKLFNDNISIILSSQFKVMGGAVRLLFYSIKPLAVMIVPVLLLLSQMGLWYQARPLIPGEEAIVSMSLNDTLIKGWPEVKIESISGSEVIGGPVRIFKKKEILWNIRATEKGYHQIVFQVGKVPVVKDLAIGDGYMRVSAMRPGWRFTDILLHPFESPFDKDSLVQAITIDYPDRISRTSGTDWWIIYFFICSMVFALIFKPVFKVRI
jgi:uncharacterized membrane protein (DUF106 family)